MYRLIPRFITSALVLLLTSGCGGGSDAVVQPRRLCAFLASCPQAQSATMQNGGTCFAAHTQPSASTTRDPEATFEANCASSSNTCQSYRDCVSRNHGPTYCTTHPGDSCDANVLVRCPQVARGATIDSAQVVPTVDCALAMGTCHEANGAAVCTTSTPCDPTTLQGASPHCDGALIVTCDSSSMRTVVASDCSVDGATCLTTPGGFGGPGRPQCVSTGAACTISPIAQLGMTTTACDGNDVLTSCQADPTQQPAGNGAQPGHTVRVSCNTDAFQGHCGVVRGVAACVHDGNECAPDSPDRCNGNALEICVNGHYEGTDCGSLGFARCTQADFTTAICTNNAS